MSDSERWLLTWMFVTKYGYFARWFGIIGRSGDWTVLLDCIIIYTVGANQVAAHAEHRTK